MRLIDADLLERKLFSLAEKYVRKRPRLALTTAINIIRCIDTVDAVPVKHGKWIRECYTYCTCSVCRTEFDKDFLYFTYRHNWQRPVYCPNCGAKMDGGD